MEDSQFILVQVPKCRSLSFQKTPEMTIRFLDSTVSGGDGGGGSTDPRFNSIVISFTDADLVNGVLRVNHMKGSTLGTTIITPIDITILSPTYGTVNADKIENINENSTLITLSSFQPLQGSWKVLIDS